MIRMAMLTIQMVGILGNSYNETLEMARIIRDELKNNRRYEKAKEIII